MFRRKQKTGFTEVFKFKGHRFYIPEKIDHLKTMRAMSFWMAMREFTLRIRTDDLDIIQERLKVAINDNNLADAGYLVNTLSAYRMMEASERTLLSVGQQYIFVDDEKNDSLNEKYKNLKQRLFDDHLEVRAFFLTKTWSLISDLLNSSKDTEIVDYLKQTEVQQIEKIFSTLIHGNGFLNSRAI